MISRIIPKYIQEILNFSNISQSPHHIPQLTLPHFNFCRTILTFPWKHVLQRLCRLENPNTCTRFSHAPFLYDAHLRWRQFIGQTGAASNHFARVCPVPTLRLSHVLSARAEAQPAPCRNPPKTYLNVARKSPPLTSPYTTPVRCPAVPHPVSAVHIQPVHSSTFPYSLLPIPPPRPVPPRPCSPLPPPATMSHYGSAPVPDLPAAVVASPPPPSPSRRAQLAAAALLACVPLLLLAAHAPALTRSVDHPVRAAPPPRAAPCRHARARRVANPLFIRLREARAWFHYHGHHQSVHEHGHGHGHYFHHHHHAHGHGHGHTHSFFAGVLGHPVSMHSFNYACVMPLLQTCMASCVKGPVALTAKLRHAKRKCLIGCAHTKCFIIGKKCHKPQFEQCATECKQVKIDDVKTCAEKCFQRVCPTQKMKEAVKVGN